LLIASVFLAGCGQTETSRLYTLSPTADVSVRASTNEQLSVGIGPVTLPQYLDRPQIVVRLSPNKLELSEFDRWAEPLSHTVPRILAANLSSLLGTERVYALPMIRRRSTDLAVAIDITQFEPNATGSASLVARWEIFTSDESQPIDEGRIATQRSGGATGDHEAMAASLSVLLGELSEVLASRITALKN
jgi:uncharacterized lipoprotein YmbA